MLNPMCGGRDLNTCEEVGSGGEGRGGGRKGEGGEGEGRERGRDGRERRGKGGCVGIT